MIRTHLLSSPSDRLKYFQDFNQTDHTWIVSNIRSKIELQEKIMEAHGHFQGDSILRISEFWKILLARHYPEKKIIPDDLLEFLAEDWIQKKPEFQIKTSSRNLLIQACHQLSDLIFSDQQDYLLQWAEENPSIHLHWIHWVEICRTFMMDIIQRKNCLSSRWIPGFLLQSFSNFNNLQFWDKKIILDLGSDLHSSEAQLFSRQGQIFAIDVLKPIPPEKKFSPQLKTYDFLELVEDGKPLPPSNQKIEILRHETALGEIQFAVAQIRKWIEQDHIPPKDIVVLFANYDSYWQKFSHLCQLEGIPLDQSIKTKIIELPLVQNWLSQCWTSCGIFDKGQTFHFLFSPEAQKIPFQSYLRKYSLYEETDDLLAIPELNFYQNGAKEITGSINIFHSLMNIFISNAKKFSNPEDQKILQKCIQFIWQNLSDFPEQVVGNYRKIIQKILTHSEISLSPSIQKSTIHTSQLQSCQIHQGVKRIYLGINQENFYVTPKIYSSEETNLMTKELNLFFEDDESGLSEFELYWQSHSHFEQTLYNYCGSDFQGELLSPHHFITEMKYFHKKNEQQPVLELSPTIYSTMGYNELSTEKSESLRKGVEQDQGLTKMAIEMSHNRIHLSATHLQNYRKCPFIYYSEKMLKLKDLPQVDFDIDLMSEGILIHSIFENLLLKKDETWEDDRLEQLLDSLKIKLKIATFDEFVWAIAKRRYLKIAKRFLDFERQWVKNNPNNHIHELEKKFQIVVHNLLSEAEMGQNIEVVFQGTIDRIETDKNLNVLLVDYKRSTSAQGSATSWIKENTLQLLFYGWLVQKYDLLDTKSLLGLVYYDYQRMNRKSSLIHRNAVKTLLSGDQADVDPQENQSFLQYFTDLELEIKTLVLKIVKNDFHPEPLNENDCPQCSWRSLCRAPHLNH